MSASQRGYLLGIVGVVIFAITLPMTRLAVERPGFAGLSPTFIAFGRAAAAAILSAIYLAIIRAPLPRRSDIAALALAGAGVVVGFPLFLGLAVQHVDAVHASVISGALPLATAALSALWLRARAPARFWLLAILGFALVLAFAWLEGSGTGFARADGLLLIAIFSAGAGYVLGARLAENMPAEQVICWLLVLYFPLTLPVSIAYAPRGPVALEAWLGFAYVAVFSMWLGFFAWYRGLATGGALRVSQIQLAQPFLSMIFAVPLLGERLSPNAALFCAAIMITVALSRRVK